MSTLQFTLAFVSVMSVGFNVVLWRLWRDESDHADAMRNLVHLAHEYYLNKYGNIPANGSGENDC